MLQMLYTWGKSHQQVLKRKQGGYHITARCFGEQITLLPLPGIKLQTVKSVAQSLY
jgi:hypothetical protein